MALSLLVVFALTTDACAGQKTPKNLTLALVQKYLAYVFNKISANKSIRIVKAGVLFFSLSLFVSACSDAPPKPTPPKKIDVPSTFVKKAPSGKFAFMGSNILGGFLLDDSPIILHFNEKVASETLNQIRVLVKANSKNDRYNNDHFVTTSITPINNSKSLSIQITEPNIKLRAAGEINWRKEHRDRSYSNVNIDYTVILPPSLRSENNKKLYNYQKLNFYYLNPSRIIYVAPNAPASGTGESWNDPTTIVKAISMANDISGDFRKRYIFMREGIYSTPIKIDHINVVYIFGGFNPATFNSKNLTANRNLTATKFSPKTENFIHSPMITLRATGGSVVIFNGISVEGFKKNVFGPIISIDNVGNTILENFTFKNNHVVAYEHSWKCYESPFRFSGWNLTIVNSSFIGNSSATAGGAICAYQESSGSLNLNIKNTSFIGNAAGKSSSEGGAIALLGNKKFKTVTNIKNSNFINNEASRGSALFVGKSNFSFTTTIINSTFTQNYGTEVLYNKGKDASHKAELNIKGSIFWDNYTKGSSAQDYLQDPSKLTGIYSENDGNTFVNKTKYSIFNPGLHTFPEDSGNITKDPKFGWFNVLNGHYTLEKDSPAIDAGMSAAEYRAILGHEARFDTDVAGNPRIFGEKIDIGAIEYIE